MEYWSTNIRESMRVKCALQIETTVQIHLSIIRSLYTKDRAGPDRESNDPFSDRSDQWSDESMSRVDSIDHCSENGLAERNATDQKSWSGSSQRNAFLCFRFMALGLGNAPSCNTHARAMHADVSLSTRAGTGLTTTTTKFLFATAWFPYDRPDRPDRPSRLKKCSSDRDDHMETLPGRSQTIANDPDDRDDRSRSGRSWKIRSDQMETLSDDRDDRDDRSLSQKASFPSPFCCRAQEFCWRPWAPTLLGRSRRSFGNQRSPQSSRSSQSSQKFFETTGTIETIRTIIWKPGLHCFAISSNSSNLYNVAELPLRMIGSRTAIKFR